jgi:predicted SAM-dependent methyltransferase
MAKLNLGCGPAVMDGWVNVDWVGWPGVDLIADLDQPWPFEDGSAGFVLASHVFEHLAEPVHFMSEAWRVLEPGGVLQVCVPYYKHPNSFADPTHKRHCTEHTFDYWIEDAPYHVQYGLGYQSPPVLFSAIRMEFGRYEREIIPNEMRIFMRKTGEVT